MRRWRALHQVRSVIGRPDLEHTMTDGALRGTVPSAIHRCPARRVDLPYACARRADERLAGAGDTGADA